jgi:hypothetical protein
MYVLTTTTLARKSGLMSRPRAILGYRAGVFLLVSTTFHFDRQPVLRARKIQETSP